MAARTNLATNPSTNRRSLNLGLIVIILLGALLSVRFAEELRGAESRARAAIAKVEDQQRRIAELRKQIPPPSVSPDQLSIEERELLASASVLIEQRVFPWSQLLHDLETNLDNDVRLTRVNVGLEDLTKVDPSRPGTAPMEISMKLIGKQLDNVVETIESLRTTGRFSRRRLQTQKIVEGTQEFEYELEMTYYP